MYGTRADRPSTSTPPGRGVGRERGPGPNLSRSTEEVRATSFDSRMHPALEDSVEAPDRAEPRVASPLPPPCLLGRAGRGPRPPRLHLLFDHVCAVRGLVVNRRSVEPLHGPSIAAKDPVPLAVPFLAGTLMVCRPVRLDGHPDVREREVHEVPGDAVLRDWGQALRLHRLVELGLDRRHVDFASRRVHPPRSRTGRRLVLQTTVRGGPAGRPHDFPHDDSTDAHGLARNGGAAHKSSPETYNPHQFCRGVPVRPLVYGERFLSAHIDGDAMAIQVLRSRQESPLDLAGEPCDVCGSATFEVRCKVICKKCGYVRDCSDP